MKRRSSAHQISFTHTPTSYFHPKANGYEKSASKNKPKTKKNKAQKCYEITLHKMFFKREPIRDVLTLGFLTHLHPSRSRRASQDIFCRNCVDKEESKLVCDTTQNKLGTSTHLEFFCPSLKLQSCTVQCTCDRKLCTQNCIIFER